MRPIEVGYTWRRLAAKCANLIGVEKTSALVAPNQVGVGTPGGAKAAIHATRRFVQQLPTGNVLIKLDLSNAFNTLRRGTMLKAVAEYIPEIYAFVYANYHDISQPQFGEYIIESGEGPQQGDPLSALLFCIATICFSNCFAQTYVQAIWMMFHWAVH